MNCSARRPLAVRALLPGAAAAAPATPPPEIAAVSAELPPYFEKLGDDLFGLGRCRAVSGILAADAEKGRRSSMGSSG